MKVTQAANVQRRTVTDYAPDPRGTQWVQGLTSVLHAGVDGCNGLLRLGDKGRPEASFNGYAGQRQAFSGQAALASYGAGNPITPGPARFDQEGSSVDVFGDDLALRIYAARARRTRR